jgi:glycerol-3-phosphate dehydrogenase
VLPGGDLPEGDFDRFVATLQHARPGMPAALLRRLARAYGTRVHALLGDAMTPFDLGTDLGGGLTLCEVDYLRAHEWAVTAEDILYRRSKLGLHVPEGTEQRLAEYLAGEPRRMARSA